MAEAIKMAESNLRLNKGGPFGAVVVKDGKIIAKGANNVTFNNDPTAHAEIVAIRAACSELNNFQLTGCDIYCSCEPCPMCLGAIYWARPSRIFYAATREDAADAGFDDALIYKELETQISDRKIETHQFLQQEARKILLEWNELNRKIPY
ncbi:MAG TPA: nucleoside deaminase [Lentimicrobium sp.]|nr:nucleoside deaminase [Lentimicrobium sp.]